MILDTSAVVAMIREEPEAKSLSWKVDRAAVIQIGAPTLVEATVVLIRRHDLPGHTALTEFLQERKVTTIPFGSRYWYAAEEAFIRFGKGRHPAGLNLGACMSYPAGLGDRSFEEVDLLLLAQDQVLHQVL